MGIAVSIGDLVGMVCEGRKARTDGESRPRTLGTGCNVSGDIHQGGAGLLIKRHSWHCLVAYPGS